MTQNIESDSRSKPREAHSKMTGVRQRSRQFVLLPFQSVRLLSIPGDPTMFQHKYAVREIDLHTVSRHLVQALFSALLLLLLTALPSADTRPALPV